MSEVTRRCCESTDNAEHAPGCRYRSRYRCADCAAVIETPEATCRTGSGGTGRATVGSPEAGNERSVCYACADRIQRADVAGSKPGDRIGAYVSDDGRHVTSWPGGILMLIRTERVIRSGFGGRQVQYWARDPDGRIWYGRSAGRGMLIRLRLTKQRTAWIDALPAPQTVAAATREALERSDPYGISHDADGRRRDF